MNFMKSFRTTFVRCLAGYLIIASLLTSPAFAVTSEDSQIFIAGFNAYQKKDYQAAIDRMKAVLDKYPDTPLRDMAIFWLARASFKAGYERDAARYMSQFFKEYPDSPLKGTVEDDLLSLVTRYDKGEQLPAMARRGAETPVSEPSVVRQALAEKTAAARQAAEQAAQKAAGVTAGAATTAVEAVGAATATATTASQAAARKAAEEKAAAERLAAEQAARERVEAERLAAQKAAQEKAAAERRAAEQAAREKAEAERVAAQKAAEERVVAERRAAEQAARERAEAERVAAQKAAEEKTVAERRAAELRAAEQAAAAKVEAERVAADQARRDREAAERLAAEKAARQKEETEQSAVRRAEEQKRAALREKAVAEYKSLIDRFPGTRAAAAAAAKLAEMGITHVAPSPAVAAAPPALPEKNAQILTLEVGQFADADLMIQAPAQGLEAGKRHEIPFEVVNRGNGTDSFYLESGFPSEFGAQFADAGRKEMPINLTPSLAPGERFRGILSIAVPREAIDGQKLVYPIKVASRLDREASQARDIFLTASAPLLRAVVKTDKNQVLPGDKVSYRVVLLNIGTAAAQGVALRLNYPPQYEPVGFGEAGFKQEMKAALVLDGMRLVSGESREFEVTFQLKDEAIARQELFLRADLVNSELQTRDSFISAAAVVKPVSGVAVRTASEKLVVIPGQQVSIPLVVTNTGNQREDVIIKPNLPPNVAYTVYQDLNRDGIRQNNEPIINHVGPLAPKEESYVILDLSTPFSESDGTAATVSLAFVPETDQARGALASLRLLYSRPVVDLVMSGKGGRLKPGEVSSFELNFTNRGSNMAKSVELQSTMPKDLELVASDPSFARNANGDYLWTFDELGASEKRTIKVTFRVRSGTAVGTSIQVKNVLKYQDQLGNRY
ncbi:outer membrane protein assembly factor BamD [Geobacter sp. 60473]|uniref:outer membrane protein assembly factor BamD n=1 Tax=Geobacter sp. 60473 TaxID=3080755 RepID=UPI0030C65BAA